MVLIHHRCDSFTDGAGVVCRGEIVSSYLLFTLRGYLLGEKCMALDFGSNGDGYGNGVRILIGRRIFENAFEGPRIIVVLGARGTGQILICNSGIARFRRGDS